MLMLPRTIRLDPSDTFVFARAAEAGEWAVTGSFLFVDADVPALTGKARAAFRAGFVGVDSPRLLDPRRRHRRDRVGAGRARSRRSPDTSTRRLGRRAAKPPARRPQRRSSSRPRSARTSPALSSPCIAPSRAARSASSSAASGGATRRPAPIACTRTPAPSSSSRSRRSRATQSTSSVLPRRSADARVLGLVRASPDAAHGRRRARGHGRADPRLPRPPRARSTRRGLRRRASPAREPDGLAAPCRRRGGDRRRRRPRRARELVRDARIPRTPARGAERRGRLSRHRAAPGRDAAAVSEPARAPHPAQRPRPLRGPLCPSRRRAVLSPAKGLVSRRRGGSRRRRGDRGA